MTENLQPKAVFHYFEEICRIPHGSGNTKQISDYLVSFAKAHGLRYVQDTWNNVIIFKDGTPGYEEKEPVILQGHMDMVCEKEADCAIDFAKDGLELAVDGDWLYAKGTTLGGDDGIAVAYALAFLEAEDIPHPPLEVIITTDEETGMDGAQNIDLSITKGTRLLNLDSEEEGHLLCGCAGGMRCDCVFDASYTNELFDAAVSISVGGLAGGHSGTEIDKGHANANQLLGQLLYTVSENHAFGLISLAGGSKDNAIPRSAQAVIAVSAQEVDAITEEIKVFSDQAFAYYEAIEPALTISTASENAKKSCVSAARSAQIVRFLMAAPVGVQAMSSDVPGLVETSLNLGIMKLEDGRFTACFSLRSMYDDRKELLAKRLQVIAESWGAVFSCNSFYPGWAFARHSALRETLVNVYEKMFGKKPQVEVLHAGLECGLLLEKRPTLDCVSMGPDILDIHTPAERLSISSTKRTWDYLCAVLKEL